jgi:hypothetical protein
MSDERKQRLGEIARKPITLLVRDFIRTSERVWTRSVLGRAVNE